MAKVKVGVCEAPPELEAGTPEWDEICNVVSREKPDLFLLNELGFGPWIAAVPEFEREAWQGSVEAHRAGLARLAELGASVVAGSRAVEVGGDRVNEAYVWSAENGVSGVHTKQFFPNEPGYFEARWYDSGERHFRVVPAGDVSAGFLLCTEVMFNEHARYYGRNGADVILSPRAVGVASLPRWLVAMRMAAIVSGCYVLTSNRGGTDSRGQAFGGRGWIVDPDGELVAQTSPTTPVVFHELDTDCVARAKKDYPCYVEE